jgi:hypothetical protein
MPSITRAPAARLVACALASFVFGLAVSRIPSPRGVGVFWVSNLSAPWLVLAFVAGWLQPSRSWAALAGLLTDVAAIVGFYLHFLLVDPGPGPFGRATPLLRRLAENMASWLGFIAPWVAYAVVAGLVFGLLGLWWSRSRSLVAGLAVSLAFVLEPFAWAIHDGRLPRPYDIWIAEAGVGFLALVWVLGAGRGARVQG